MTIITPSLFGPITSNAPAGVDMEYDAAFQRAQRLGEGVNEQQYGNTIVAAKPPEWATLYPLATKLCQQTRDLRIGVLLVESATHQVGLEGTVDGLNLLVNWITELWPELYPALDPDEDNDGFMRVNSLGRLCQPERLPTLIRETLVLEQPPHFRVLGSDLLAMTGSSDIDSDGESTRAETESVLASADQHKLQLRFDQLQSIIGSLREIERALEKHVGESLWSVETMIRDLQCMQGPLEKQLRQRFHVRDAVLESADDLSEVPHIATHHLGNPMSDSKATTDPISIRSREHAFEAIEAITAYFAKNEPSSPVPLLLRRVRRLAERDFIEILRELAPSALDECRQITGSHQDAA